MAVLPTQTVSVTIDAPPAAVAADLADLATHPAWAHEFFAAPAVARDDGTFAVDVPRMGGPARARVDAAVEHGVIDLYLAPEGAPFGPPLPIRVVPNGDGCDVLFTLARFPRTDDADWEAGLASMRRELDRLRLRHETR